MLLTEQQIGIRNMAREFARREIVPFAAGWDRDHEVPVATIAKMFEVGLMGVCVPPAWGGAGADFVSLRAGDGADRLWRRRHRERHGRQ